MTESGLQNWMLSRGSQNHSWSLDLSLRHSSQAQRELESSPRWRYRLAFRARLDSQRVSRPEPRLPDFFHGPSSICKLSPNHSSFYAELPGFRPIHFLLYVDVGEKPLNVGTAVPSGELCRDSSLSTSWNSKSGLDLQGDLASWGEGGSRE